MTLQEELTLRQREIQTDSYSMSIGELINLYENGEIDIHPEFQRFFRWSLQQKSRLIESILIGIPLPPIFVSQRADGVWDVIDGLQRLGTIFEFAGILRDEDNNRLAPLRLADQGYDYLNSLANLTWESTEAQGETASLTQPQRLYIKRSKLDVKIILKQSDPRARLDLFQRLNTGGSSLSAQEVRNCLLIMSDPTFYRWVRDLSKFPAFVNCLSITDRAYNEQYDMELLLRFLVLRRIPEGDIRDIGDINMFLDRKSVEIATSQTFDRGCEQDVFTGVFSALEKACGDNAFRRFRRDRGYVGGFLSSAFEAIAIGLGYNYNVLEHGVAPEAVMERITQLWLLEDFAEGFAAGQRASSRIPRTIPLGRQFFATV